MEFFDKLAAALIGFIKGTWAAMVKLAVLIVSPLTWYGGVAVDPTIAAILVYGMLIFAGGAWLFFGSALKFRK